MVKRKQLRRRAAQAEYAETVGEEEEVEEVKETVEETVEETIEEPNEDEEIEDEVPLEVTPVDFGMSAKNNALLNEAGVKSIEELKTMSKKDLTAINGIGPATADSILKALEE